MQLHSDKARLFVIELTIHSKFPSHIFLEAVLVTPTLDQTPVSDKICLYSDYQSIHCSFRESTYVDEHVITIFNKSYPGK